MKRINWPALVVGLVFFIFIVVFIVVLFYFQTVESELFDLVGRFGYIGVFLIAFLADMIMQPIGPDVPIILGIVGGLNPIWVFLAGLLGSYLASICGYVLGTRFGEQGFIRWYGEKRYNQLTKKYYKSAKIMVFLGAITPVPYVPVCWLAGMFEMRMRDFLFFAVFARSVRLLVVVLFTVWII